MATPKTPQEKKDEYRLYAGSADDDKTLYSVKATTYDDEGNIVDLSVKEVDNPSEWKYGLYVRREDDAED